MKTSLSIQIDRVPPDLPTGTHLVEPHRQAVGLEHGESVGGLDTRNAQDRAGVDDRAPRAALDHRDVRVAQDQTWASLRSQNCSTEAGNGLYGVTYSVSLAGEP